MSLTRITVNQEKADKRITIYRKLRNVQVEEDAATHTHRALIKYKKDIINAYLMKSGAWHAYPEGE